MALSEVIAKLGFQLDDKNLKAAEKGVEGFMNTLQKFGQLFVVGTVAMGAKRFIGDLVNIGSEIQDQADAVGLSTDSLQQWRHTAGLAGVDNGALATAFGKLQQNAVAAAEGSKEAKETFEKLGVNVKDASGNFKEVDQLLVEVGGGIDALGSSAEKTAVAKALLGKAGGKLVPVFKGGSKAIRENLGELAKLGGLLDKDTIGALDEVGDNAARVEASWLGLKVAIAREVLPIIASSLESLSKWIAKFKKWADDTGFFKSALLTLAAVSFGPLLGALRSLAMAVALPALKFAILFLVIDDLKTFFQGGDSLIGRGLDAIFGKGAQNTARQALLDIWTALSQNDWEGAGQKVLDAFDKMGEGIVNAIAGIDLDSAVEEHMAESGESFASVLINGIIFGLEGFATEFAIPLMKGIYDAFAHVASTMAEGVKIIVNALIDGFVDGLSAGAGAVADVFDRVFGEPVKGLQKRFEVKSPSRFMMRLGANLDKGMALGLMSGNAAKAFNAMLPMPGVKGPTNVNQSNVFNTTVTGVRDPMQAANIAQQGISRQNRTHLQELEAALVGIA